MPAKKDSNQPRPEGQPTAEGNGYPRNVISDLANLIIPQAIQIVTMPTDSPADAYRRELGELVAPSLLLWFAMDQGTDPIELYGLYMAAEDEAYNLTQLLKSGRFVKDVFIALTGQEATVPALAWQIITGHESVETLRQEITHLAESDPESAAYLFNLLNEYGGDDG